MEMTLKPIKILKGLLIIVFLLVLLNFIDLLSTHYFHINDFFGNYKLKIYLNFNLDREYSIPTYYAALSLLLSSILLGTIAFLKKNDRSEYYYWIGLSVLFLFLSIDELRSIHEKLSGLTRDYLNTSGVFYFAWIIPYGIALILFLILYTRFIFQLPKTTRYLFLLSGIIFISGAIGVEMLEGKHAALFGKDTLIYALLYTFEETLEMLGIAVFIYALISYIGKTIKSFTIIFK